MSVKITDLTIDTRSFGKDMFLTGVAPFYNYVDGKRTDDVVGFRYSIAFPKLGLDKLDVKVEGEQQIDAEDLENGFIPVRLEGFEVKPYFRNNNVNLTAKAKNIHIVQKAHTG